MVFLRKEKLGVDFPEQTYAEIRGHAGHALPSAQKKERKKGEVGNGPVVVMVNTMI